MNERGKSDAPLMANRLVDLDIKIDALIASPAKRAKQTAELFAQVLKTSKDSIHYVSALYHAPAEVFYEVIAGLSDDLSNIALFSHNPGITHFVNDLQSAVKIDNLPTCGIFSVEADISHWKDILKANKTFLFFDYPKK